MLFDKVLCNSNKIVILLWAYADRCVEKTFLRGEKTDRMSIEFGQRQKIQYGGHSLQDRDIVSSTLPGTFARFSSSGYTQWQVKAKFHYAILVADRSEAGRKPVADLLAHASSLVAS